MVQKYDDIFMLCDGLDTALSINDLSHSEGESMQDKVEDRFTVFNLTTKKMSSCLSQHTSHQ
jgi:hypothetical protein